MPKKLAKNLPSKFLQRIYHHNKFTVKINNKKSFFLSGTQNSFENSIFWYSLLDSKEGYSINLLIQLINLEKKLRFWDIGANSGIYSLLVRHTVPDSIVIAFEPSSSCYKKLIKNCNLNAYTYCNLLDSNLDLNSIIISNYALSLNNKFFNFYYYTHDDDFTYGGQAPIEGKNPVKIEKVKSISASEIIKSNVNLVPNFLKIDIEGYEYEALLGFKEFLQDIKVILIEILDDINGKKIESCLTPDLYRYFDVNDQSHMVCELSHLQRSSFRNWLIVRRDQMAMLSMLESHIVRQ